VGRRGPIPPPSTSTAIPTWSAGAAIVEDPALAEKIGFLPKRRWNLRRPAGLFPGAARHRRPWPCAWRSITATRSRSPRWLSGHPKVAVVLHPGLETHPQHALAQKQMRGYGGHLLIPSEGRSGRGVSGCWSASTCSRLRVARRRESLDRTPVDHDARLRPRRGAWKRMGITPDLIRISVGIEDLDDLAGGPRRGPVSFDRSCGEQQFEAIRPYP